VLAFKDLTNVFAEAPPSFNEPIDPGREMKDLKKKAEVGEQV
jgi:hypothetical protein